MRSWYQIPVKTGKQSWSEIYPHITGNTLYLGAGLPVYNKKSNLKKVLLSNLNLLQLGTFLQGLKIGKTGETFIIERSGMLVATSTKEKPFRFTKEAVALPENKVKRLKAKDSGNLRTQATAKYLEAKFGNFNSIKSEQQLDFTINGKRQFIQVLPFQDNRGIDWLIVVVVPEDDFMEEINANTQTTIVVCIVALIVAVAFGVLILRWITYEIAAFIDITERKQAQRLLVDYNSILEQQVAERTLELQREIVERKRAEVALVESKARLREASVLAERNRLAQEIHDTLAQAFAVIIIHLDTASRKLTTDIEAARVSIKPWRDLAHSGLTDARRSVKALRPQLLEEGDLCSAFQRFATQMFSHTNTRIVCQVVGEKYPLPSDVENNLLRIGQEALTNAFKYAQAREIQIELAYQLHKCILRIEDDGQGFDVSSVSVVNSFGLLVMSERAERIKAKLTIHSSPGEGTEVTVLVHPE